MSPTASAKKMWLFSAAKSEIKSSGFGAKISAKNVPVFHHLHFLWSCLTSFHRNNDFPKFCYKSTLRLGSEGGARETVEEVETHVRRFAADGVWPS